MLAVIIPMLIGVYFVSPMFLPRWRWENMRDFGALSTQLKVPAAKLRQTYQVVLRYNPRGETDSSPWQILQTTPLYDPDNDDEFHVVRTTLIGDRNGEPPSKLRLGSGNYRDQFFTSTVWRFPPGAFGKNRFRPVTIYDSSTFDKVTSNEAYTWNGQMTDPKWTNDDEEIDDGFKPAGATEE